MIKLLGAVMVVAACTMAGFEFASRLEKRKNNIGALKSGAEVIEREMQFFKAPLYILFLRAAENTPSPVSDVFFNVSEKIKKEPQAAEEIWREEIRRAKGELRLSKSDVRLIKNIFSGIGKTDSVSQRKVTAAAISALRAAEAECAVLCGKNVKVYKSLGVLLGIFIALLFI